MSMNVEVKSQESIEVSQEGMTLELGFRCEWNMEKTGEMGLLLSLRRI